VTALPDGWVILAEDDLELRAIRAAFAATWDVGQFLSSIEAYWKTGAGAAKVRWGTPGSHTRCVRHLRKHLGGSADRAHRVCAQWEHDVTGHWPGEKKGKNPKGRG
jgi:hypothetical protein